MKYLHSASRTLREMTMTFVMERAGFWKMNGSESAKSRLKHEELARQLVRRMQDAYS